MTITTTIEAQLRADGQTKWMTPRQVADLFGCTTQYVYKLCTSGTLRAHRPWPRKVLINRESVEAFQSGNRPAKETVTAAKRYVLRGTLHNDINAMSVDEISGAVYEYIRNLHGGDWHRTALNEWTEDTVDKLVAGR